MSARYLPAVVIERWRSPPEPMRDVRVLHVVDLESEDVMANDSIERLTGKVEPHRALCAGVLDGSLSMAEFQERCPECTAALSRAGFSLLINAETKTVIGVVAVSTFRAIERSKKDLANAKVMYLQKEHSRENDPRPDPYRPRG
jgi:hypothetical protein